MTKWLIAVIALFSALTASAQLAQPLLQPRVYFVDGSGNPCVGCSLYSYIAGTTTPQPTYTSASGASQNTNPVILDSTGSATVWMGSLSYKFALLDTFGTTLWTVDQVTAPQPGGTGLFLPLTGGTLTGSLTAPFFHFTANADACGAGLFVTGWSSTGWICSAVSAVNFSALVGNLGTTQGPLLTGILKDTAGTLSTASAGTDYVIPSGSISGNAGTATALAAVPTNCTAGNTSYGIGANGNALCNAGGGPTLQQALVITTGICTTGTSSYAQCASTTANWGTAFPDTSYGVSCTGVGMMTGNVTQLWVSTKSTTGVVISLQNGSASGAVASTWAEIDCVGKHN